MRFHLKSVFAGLTCSCLMLSLNSIPWSGESTRHFYDFPGTFKLKDTSYGWPFTYARKSSAYDLPPKLPGDLTVEEIEAPLIPSRFKYRIFDNLIVIGLASLALFILIESACRRGAKLTAETQPAK